MGEGQQALPLFSHPSTRVYWHTLRTSAVTLTKHTEPRLAFGKQTETANPFLSREEDVGTKVWGQGAHPGIRVARERGPLFQHRTLETAVAVLSQPLPSPPMAEGIALSPHLESSEAFSVLAAAAETQRRVSPQCSPA